MRRKRFGLLGRFAVLSAVLISALGLLLGAALHRSIKDRAVANAVDSGELATVAIRSLVRPDDLDRDFVPLEPQRVEALDDALRDLLPASGIVRLELWNRQHWLVYSDNEDLVGRWFPSTDLLDRTFDGDFGSEITDLTAPEQQEDEGGTLLALSVPLRDDASGEVVGALQVYLPYAPVVGAIAADSRAVYVALGAGLLVLYAALFRLVASAFRRLQRQTEENLRQATHDGLTGLPNRGLFTDRLENTLAIAGRQGTGLAVVLLDLDRFKDINDALGHASGDEILCELAQRLQHRLRAGDTVARLGGDEFGFLLPAVASDADAVAVAADMQELLDEPFMVNGMAVHLAASFGVACHPDHGLDAGELVRHADVAMYAAKATNTVIEVYGPQFDPHSAERLELAAEVRRALDEDELELWYQPKMDLVDGHIVGVEALLRWNHPTRGIVAPGLFMPVVETTELVRAVTAFVLKEAVAQCSRWKLDGRDLTVAINVPARNAHDLRLPGQVADLLASHHLPASALECELTESAVLDHPDRARQVLSELDRLGVHLSIDDFGTGYASLAYLTDLPIHALKIDQSFVGDVLGGGDGAAIVRFSTDLARMLGLQVVAEGVESREVLAAVADLGCDLAQGYLLTEPIPAAELEAWLDAFDPQTLTLPREAAPA